MMILKHTVAASLIFLGLAICVNAADPTEGGTLIRHDVKEGWRSRWVGPLGVYCGLWKPDENYLNQLLVQTIDKGAPADGVLKVGDMVIGADGTGAKNVSPFAGGEWALDPIADAISEAEARDPAVLNLLIWRATPKKAASKVKLPGLDDLGGFDDVGAGLDDWGPGAKKKAAGGKSVGKPTGQTMTVTIKLEFLGRYSETAPYDCEKSKNILRKGVQAIYEGNKADKAGFNMLCLLAADDPTNPANDKYQARAKEWAHQLIVAPDADYGNGPWFSGPQLISLSEYYLKTKDKAVFPTLVRRAEYHARRISWFGTSGHKWADKKPNGSYGGRLSGYGPIGASGALGFLGLSLAREAGVESPIVDHAIERQSIFFGHYAFRGAPSYGEFIYDFGGSPGDNNGKCAMSALALGLQDGQEKKAKYFGKMTTLSTVESRRYVHGGPYFGQVWQPIGAAQGGKQTANLHFREIRRHLDLKRRWNHTRLYDGTGNGYEDFGQGATALLFYATPLNQLVITGRDRQKSLELSDAEFEELLAVKNFDAEKLSNEDLLAALSDYDGMCRSAVGDELANRIKAKPEAPAAATLIDDLIALATNGAADVDGRAGACRALMVTKEKAKGAVSELKNAAIARAMVGLLQDEDPFLWFSATKVLQEIDIDAVRPYVSDVLDTAVAHARPAFPLRREDPLQASQIRLAQLCGSLLKSGLDGVDREKLVATIRALLDQPHANGRNAASEILSKLTTAEVMAITPAIVDTIRVGPPANAMGGEAARDNSQKVLAAHRFEEGLPLNLSYGAARAIKTGVHRTYGAASFDMHATDEIMQALGDSMLVEATIDANAAAEQMRTAAKPDKMLKLKIIQSINATPPILRLPETKTGLQVEAKNYLLADEDDTVYTWRKVYGPGSVAFAPNASEKSTTTTVTFTDRKPGKYRFEVNMSDVLDYSDVHKTVDVILHDMTGKLPANGAPEAISRTIETVVGKPTKISLTGKDPDGDDLGFVVTKRPSHGRLSGTGGDFVYVANYGNPNHEKAAKKAEKLVLPKAPSLDDFDALGSFGGIAVKPRKETAERKNTDHGSWTDSMTFECIDGQAQKATGTVTFKISDQDVGVAVYDGFDYPSIGVHGLEAGSSFGFGGPWMDSKNSREAYKVERAALKVAGTNQSLVYASLPASGGKVQALKGRHTLTRLLDPGVLAAHKLLENGGGLWFSIVVDEQVGKAFGLEGPGFKLGAKTDGKNAKRGVYANLEGVKEASLDDRNVWSRDADRRFPKGPNMIVCHYVWGKTDADLDTLTIHRVWDAPDYGPVFLEKPVASVRARISQTKINKVYLSFDTGVADEIRIGPTLNSVMAGTKPLTEKTVSRK